MKKFCFAVGCLTLLAGLTFAAFLVLLGVGLTFGGLGFFGPVLGIFPAAIGVGMGAESISDLIEMWEE